MNKLNDVFTVWKQLPEPKWLVENVILQNTITLIAGSSNSGKTLLCTDLMLQMSKGEKWLGHNTEKTNVMFLDLEMGSGMFCYRLQKHTNGKIPDNLWYQETSISLYDDEKIVELISVLKEQEIGLLIIDSYSQLSIGAEENNNSQQAIVMRKLYSFRDNGISLIILHHKRKGAENDNSLDSLRGGSSIAAGADTVLMLTKNADTFKLKTTKDRLNPYEKWIDITYRFIITENGTISTEIVGNNIDRDDTMIAQIIRLLEDGELSGNEISKAIGRNRKDTSDCLKNMTTLGIVNQNPKEPKRGQRVKFSLIKTEDTDTETLD
jgi:hypothetical protein